MIAVLADHNIEGQATLLPTALPVVTIGNLDQMVERSYREACADRLIEIGMDLDTYRGTGRIYIP